ncbi:MAG: cysteate synthase [Candidatus Hermodarchaeota archaeon]
MGYRVICQTCHKELKGYALSCHSSSLLRTEFTNSLTLQPLPGLWRFIDWLPCSKPLSTKAGSVTFRSNGLAKELGLKNLYLAFTGYWPEREAWNLTGSFKDLESNPTIARAKENGVASLVVASVGNTARAFGHLANQAEFDVYLVVPESGLDMLWTPEPPTEKIHLLVIKGDYNDAIHFADQFSQTRKAMPEGGVKNVARRDGMGTVMLDGAFTMKRLPDHYFQAIGSGTGAIGSWEMAMRLKNQGWRGDLTFHLSQNAPFVPIYNAWQAGRRQIKPADMPNAKQSIEQLHALVLSNRTPPYSIQGGVYDTLTNTHGQMYSVTNKEARQAGKKFKHLEGVDLLPAAEVAVASLIQAVENEKISKSDYILLNVTGGGLKRLEKDFGFHKIEPEQHLQPE